MNQINNTWIIFAKYPTYHQLIKGWIAAIYFYSNTNIFPLGINKINHFNFFCELPSKVHKIWEGHKNGIDRLEFIPT